MRFVACQDGQCAQRDRPAVRYFLRATSAIDLKGSGPHRWPHGYEALNPALVYSSSRMLPSVIGGSC